MCDVPVDAVFGALPLLSNCFPHESLLWIEDDWPKERKRKGKSLREYLSGMVRFLLEGASITSLTDALGA